MRMGSTLRGSEGMLQGAVVAGWRAGWREDSIAPPPPPPGETASLTQAQVAKRLGEESPTETAPSSTWELSPVQSPHSRKT